MKHLFLSLTLMLSPYFIFAHNLDNLDLSGYWYSQHLSSSIKIKDKENVLLVKGLNGTNATQVFGRINAKTYEDKRGNRFIIDHCDAIFFISRRNHYPKKVFFEKIGRAYNDLNDRSHYKQHSYFEDDFENFDENNYGKPQSHTNSNEYQNGRSNWLNYEEKISGTWRTEKGNMSIVIIDTRDGLKAKLTGTTKWVSYVQNIRKPYEFVDDNGNKYVFNEDLKATWISADRDKRTIPIYKSSSEMQY